MRAERERLEELRVLLASIDLRIFSYLLREFTQLAQAAGLPDEIFVLTHRSAWMSDRRVFLGYDQLPHEHHEYHPITISLIDHQVAPPELAVAYTPDRFTGALAARKRLVPKGWNWDSSRPPVFTKRADLCANPTAPDVLALVIEMLQELFESQAPEFDVTGGLPY